MQSYIGGAMALKCGHLQIPKLVVQPLTWDAPLVYVEEETMKRLILLSSILLLSAWAVAQYGSQPDASQSSMSTGKTTVEGCLAQAGSGYTLTDNSGTSYQLTGDTSKLQAHVGHTVQLTGTTASGADSSGMAKSGSMSGSADMQKTLAVTSLKHVHTGCAAAH